MTTGIARKGMGKACKATQRRGLASSLEATVVTGYTPGLRAGPLLHDLVRCHEAAEKCGVRAFLDQQLLAGLPGDSTNGEQPPTSNPRPAGTNLAGTSPGQRVPLQLDQGFFRLLESSLTQRSGSALFCSVLRDLAFCARMYC